MKLAVSRPIGLSLNEPARTYLVQLLSFLCGFVPHICHPAGGIAAQLTKVGFDEPHHSRTACGQTAEKGRLARSPCRLIMTLPSEAIRIRFPCINSLQSRRFGRKFLCCCTLGFRLNNNSMIAIWIRLIRPTPSRESAIPAALFWIL